MCDIIYKWCNLTRKLVLIKMKKKKKKKKKKKIIISNFPPTFDLLSLNVFPL